MSSCNSNDHVRSSALSRIIFSYSIFPNPFLIHYKKQIDKSSNLLSEDTSHASLERYMQEQSFPDCLVNAKAFVVMDNSLQ